MDKKLKEIVSHRTHRTFQEIHPQGEHVCRDEFFSYTVKENGSISITVLKMKKYECVSKFILLYEPGEGDYTKERKELFKNFKIEEIVKDITVLSDRP